MKFLSFLLTLSTVNAIANPLYFRQWPIENKGQPIFIRESELNFPAQAGIAGIDINYYAPKDLNTEVVVAVIDTGVDLEHEDLKGRFWVDPNCQEEDKSICTGKNFLNPKAAPLDDKGHGTHVAGIIAANDNAVGIKGVSTSNIKIMPLKVLNSKVDSFVYNRRLMSDYFAEAIQFAVDNNAHVINMSAGFPQLVLTPKFRKAVASAEQKQVPIVVAAGNNNKDIPVFPCSLKGVICVGSIDNRGEYSEFSNYGQAVDILAPGESIISTYPTDRESRSLRIMGYEKLKGTSQASPFVAGIAAMIKATHPDESLDQLKARLFCHAHAVNKTNHKFSLFGRVDMKNAILGALPECVTLNFKENNQIVIKNSDLSFEYDLELKLLSGSQQDLIVSIQVDDRVTLENKTGHVQEVQAGEDLKYTIKGKFNDINADSIVPFLIEVKSINKSYNFEANLSFSLGEGAIKTKDYRLNGVRAAHVFQKRSGKNYSLLSYVFSATNSELLPEYFYQMKEPSLKKPTYGLVLISGESAQTKRLELDEEERLINMIKGDYNFDGKSDYLALVQKLGESVFYLRYLDQELMPLMENNSIRFNDDSKLMNLESPINPDGNLLNFQKRMVNFEWMKYNLNGQDLLLPIIRHEGLLPTEDNSVEFVDFEAPELSVRRYTIIPKNIDGELVAFPRVLMSVQREEEIREELYYSGFEIEPWETIRIENPLKAAQDNNGITEYLLSVGEFYLRRYFRYQILNENQYIIEPIEAMNYVSQEIILSGNTTFAQVKPNKASDDLVSFSLSQRHEGRLAYTEKNSGETYVQLVETEGYSDPIFGFLSGMHLENKYSSYFESRYWIHYFGDDDQHYIYPVNRESSFPGVEFSETMESVIAKKDGKLIPSIFVNSTLLYGNQIHVITLSEKGLVRPLKYTVEIPKDCSYVLPAKLEQDSFDSLVLNCFEKGRAVLKFVNLD